MKFIVVLPLTHDKERFAPGDEVEFEEAGAVAHELLACGAIAYTAEKPETKGKKNAGA